MQDDTTTQSSDARSGSAGRLADLFERQADLARFYRSVRRGGFYDLEPIARCTTWTRAIVHECCELDDELNWKPWKNARDLADTREARLAEMADILHFYLQLALDQGFSADEIVAAYLRKNAENRERQRTDARYRPSDPRS
jgi:hypothetical protein